MALSRATTLDGLHLLDFDVRVVRAHGKVKAFYAGLEVRTMGFDPDSHRQFGTGLKRIRAFFFLFLFCVFSICFRADFIRRIEAADEDESGS